MMDGFEYIQSNSISHPKYWIKLDGQWHNYQLTGLEKLDLNAPVAHVSFYEADAFARWKGLRLPTEFEWEVAAKKYCVELTGEENFVQDQNYRPIGSKGMFGDLWEWTASAYRPYPHYEAPEGALGEYNGKFMINQMVLRGGSYATPRDHIRHTYRNFFHPHLQWLFSGIRLARFK
jgi:ergothioneine biosynthesis protein EgtB